jgi:hypothetical protein
MNLEGRILGVQKWSANDLAAVVLFKTPLISSKICPEGDSFGPEAKLCSCLLARNVPHASKTVWRYLYVILERILLCRRS